MNKEFIINFINKSTNTGNLSIEDAVKIFIHYCCEEHNKDLNITQQFITIITQLGLFSSYLNEVLSYYKKKYNLIEITDKNNNFITIY